MCSKILLSQLGKIFNQTRNKLSMNLKRLATGLITLAFIGAPLTATAQTFYSTPQDEAFLSGVRERLAEKGMSDFVSDQDKIAVVKKMCGGLGRTLNDWDRYLLGTAYREGLSDEQIDKMTDYFVVLEVRGIHNYCPQHLHFLQN
jgi:hypothetical protein